MEAPLISRCCALIFFHRHKGTCALPNLLREVLLADSYIEPDTDYHPLDIIALVFLASFGQNSPTFFSPR